MRGSTPQAPADSARASGAGEGGAGTTARAVPREPPLLGGRYLLLEAIGGRGMGIVYLARDGVLDRTVAVKLLPDAQAADSSAVARFEREARAAARLCHPNIVSVYDAGTDEATRFIVMEHVRGASLAELLRQEGAFPPVRAAAIAAQIARALAAAHRSGVVHRDVKPANVMVEESGAAKLLDFGIARAGASTTLTRTGSVLGSAPYIAPEVARGRTAEERSDVYALGCVLYETLAGRPPFTGEHAAAVLHQHASVRATPPRELDPSVPAALEALAMRMLEKRPSSRPRAAAAADTLERVARGESATARARRGPSPTMQTARLASRPARPRRARRGRPLAVALATLVACAALAGALLARDGRPSGAAASTAAARGRDVAPPTRGWQLLADAGGAYADASTLALAALVQLQPPVQAAPPPPAASPPPQPTFGDGAGHDHGKGHDHGQKHDRHRGEGD